jgi:DNA-binding MarR family transcriptional regulator
MNDRVRDINGLDRVVHEPARLMIVTILSVVEAADFVYLLHETALNKGTLSSHLARLEEAGYVEIKKTFRGKVPRTLLRLTKPGRQAFEEYRQKLGGALSKGSSPKRGIVTSSGRQ